MNVYQWHPTPPIQPQTVVHSYQPVQPIAPTSTPLFNTSLPLLKTQIFVPQPFQVVPSTQYPQVLGPQTPTPSVGLQQPPVSRIIYFISWNTILWDVIATARLYLSSIESKLS